MSEHQSASARLRHAREKSGLSLQKMADRAGVPLSTYRHYEERYKGAYLPQQFVAALAPNLGDVPKLREEVLSLASMDSGMRENSAPYQSGAHARGAALLSAMNPETPSTTHPPLRIGSDGHVVQIVATVDKAGIDELIRKLRLMQEMLN